MLQMRKGNRQVSKRNLMLVDKYVKKEKKVKSEDSGNVEVPPAPQSET
jgi:hypothetical protein